MPLERARIPILLSWKLLVSYYTQKKTYILIYIELEAGMWSNIPFLLTGKFDIPVVIIEDDSWDVLHF